MVSQAHTARLNSAPLISLSASSLQANIYQLIGLKAAPLGGNAFWRQLNMAQVTGCDVVGSETKASLLHRLLPHVPGVESVIRNKQASIKYVWLSHSGMVIAYQCT